MRGNVHGGKMRDEKQICLGVRIKKEMHTELLKIAKDNELGLSDIVRMALKEFICKNT